MKVKKNLYYKLILLITVALTLNLFWDMTTSFLSKKEGQLKILYSDSSKVTIQFRDNVREALEYGEPITDIENEYSVFMDYYVNLYDEIAVISLIDQNGRLLSSSKRRIDLNDQIKEEMSDGETIIRVDDLHVAFLPIRHNGTLHGYFLVGYYSRNLSDEIRSSMINTFVPKVLGNLIILFITIFLARRHFINPVQNILNWAQEIIDTQDPDLPIRNLNDDEIGDIGNMMMRMMNVISRSKTTLETLEKQEKRIVDYIQTQLEPIAFQTKELSNLCYHSNVQFQSDQSFDTPGQMIRIGQSKIITTCQNEIIKIQNHVAIVKEAVPVFLDELKVKGKSIQKLERKLQRQNWLKEEKKIRAKLPSPQIHLKDQKLTPILPIQEVGMNEKKRVIVFDDFYQDLYIEYRLNESFELKFFKNADHCLEECEAFSPHLVIMDLKMGAKLDGFEACQQIMERFPHVGVIFITGESYGSLPERCFKVGGRGVFEKKEINYHDLCFVLDGILQGYTIIAGDLSRKFVNFVRATGYNFVDQKYLSLEGKNAGDSAKIIGTRLGIKDSVVDKYYYEARKRLSFSEEHYHTHC